MDGVSHLLKDVKHFTVFDATKGFFHLPIDALSRLLTAMLTPEGVFVFNVLAMGLQAIYLKVPYVNYFQVYQV